MYKTMDLLADHGEMHFTHQDWRLLIQLALQNGWSPMSALPPESRYEKPLHEGNCRAPEGEQWDFGEP